MKFNTIVVGFEEDNAPRDPYFMGFVLKDRNYVVKGAFLEPLLTPIGEGQKIGWGENNSFQSEILADLLLKDCLGEQAKPDLVSQLSESLMNFHHANGFAWLVYADDLMKWINLPKYGIIPRVGYLASLEDKVLTIKFPVAGTNLN